MNSAQSLMTMLKHAERERDAALVEAQRIAQAQLSAQGQVEQLVSYRHEYRQRWSEQFARSGGIAIVRCYQGFMQRLDHAIEQQQRVALQAAQHSAHAAEALRQHETRVASVRKLLERRERALRGADDRRAQKQADEQSSRARWSRPADGTLPSTL